MINKTTKACIERLMLNNFALPMFGDLENTVLNAETKEEAENAKAQLEEMQDITSSYMIDFVNDMLDVFKKYVKTAKDRDTIKVLAMLAYCKAMVD